MPKSSTKAAPKRAPRPPKPSCQWCPRTLVARPARSKHRVCPNCDRTDLMPNV